MQQSEATSECRAERRKRPSGQVRGIPGKQQARAPQVKPAAVGNSKEASVAGAGKKDDAVGDGGHVGCGKQFGSILSAVRSL